MARNVWAARATASAGSPPQADTVLMIDADHFKLLDDTYGQAFGDTCLRALADHLRSCPSAEDLVERMRGAGRRDNRVP